MWYVKRGRGRGRARGSKQLYPRQESCKGGLAQVLLNAARDLPKRSFILCSFHGQLRSAGSVGSDAATTAIEIPVLVSVIRVQV